MTILQSYYENSDTLQSSVQQVFWYRVGTQLCVGFYACHSGSETNEAGLLFFY